MTQLVSLKKYRSFLYFLSSVFLLCILYTLLPSSSIPLVKEQVKSETRILNTTKRQSLKNYQSCYYSNEEYALLSTKELNVIPEDKTIFFIESSCSGVLNSRQACSIEAAARLHPRWKVNVLFCAPVSEDTLKTSSLSKLLELNVNMYRLHIDQYAEGTIVEEILVDRVNNSVHPIEHISDILRILTLHKYGGVYLDTDAILIKNIDSLPPNWIAAETDMDLASGAMAFSKDGAGAYLTSEILREIRDTFRPESWSHNGPQAIQRVVDRLCPDVFKEPSSARSCNGMNIFTHEDFYPIHYSFNNVYFRNGSIKSMEGPYMHHMWNYLTKNLKIEHNSPYANLAKEFCPTIYKTYNNDFGQ